MIKNKLLCFLFLLGFTCNAQIVNIESYRLPNDTSKIAGNLDGIFNLNKNQKTIYQFGFNSNIEFNQKKHTLMLVSIYNWVKTIDNNVSDDFLNDGFQHLRYNYVLNKKMKLEAFGQYQYNKMMNLKERELLGIGIRYKLTDSKIRTYVGTSVMYEHDVIDDLLSNKVDYIKSSNYITCSVMFGHFRLSNTTYFQFNINNAKYRVYTVMESTINIYKKIAYKINFVLQYDNDEIYNAPLFMYSTNNRISISF